MNDFWVCQHCRSLNRAGSGRCYHCREKMGSKPSEPDAPRGQVSQNVTQFPAAPPAGAPLTTPTGRAAVPAGVPPAYVSRPTAAPSAPVRSYSERYLVATPQRGLHLPSLTGALRRRLAWSLATHPYVSIRPVGYLTAVLATLLLLDGALAIATYAPVARTALETGSIAPAMSQLTPGSQRVLQLMLVSLGALLLLGVVVGSIFVGLSTHNAAGLGAEPPYLSEARAGSCWFRLLRTQLLVAAGLLAPAALIAQGYPLPGLIVGLVAVEVAQRRMDDPFGWLTDPARQLSELYVKLGLSGLNKSLLASTWRFFFLAANALMVVAFALPVMVIAAVATASLAGHSDVIDWPGASTGPVQISIIVVLASLVFTAASATALLVPMSLELVSRQRTRRGLAKVGRSRPWAARPGATDAPAERIERALYDPYELPRSPDPDQASLNSPSTTSSFPWEDGSSEEGSPPD